MAETPAEASPEAASPAPAVGRRREAGSRPAACQVAAARAVERCRMAA